LNTATIIYNRYHRSQIFITAKDLLWKRCLFAKSENKSYGCKTRKTVTLA